MTRRPRCGTDRLRGDAVSPCRSSMADAPSSIGSSPLRALRFVPQPLDRRAPTADLPA